MNVCMYEHQSKTVACSEVDYRESNERMNDKRQSGIRCERENKRTNKRMRETVHIDT